MSEVRTGSCGCGAVKFKTSWTLRSIIYCHCTQCRNQSWHFFAATNVSDDRIAVEGLDNITWYRGSETAKRGFCCICGSVLFWKHDELDTISVMAGAFDTPSGLRAECHIFVADKGDYYEIDDGLPQFEKSNLPSK